MNAEPDSTHGTSCSLSGDVLSCSATGYSSGINKVYVECTDAAGNWSTGHYFEINYNINPPALVSATISSQGTYLSLAFDQVMVGHSGFILNSSISPKSLQYNSGEGTNTLTFFITYGEIPSGQTLTVSYVQGDVEGANGLYLAAFSNAAVNNTSTIPAPTVTLNITSPQTITNFNELTITGTASFGTNMATGCQCIVGKEPDMGDLGLAVDNDGIGCTGKESFSCQTTGFVKGSNIVCLECYRSDPATYYTYYSYGNCITVNYNPSTPTSTEACYGCKIQQGNKMQ
jgi:hypothetical protein